MLLMEIWKSKMDINGNHYSIAKIENTVNGNIVFIENDSDTVEYELKRVFEKREKDWKKVTENYNNLVRVYRWDNVPIRELNNKKKHFQKIVGTYIYNIQSSTDLESALYWR